MSDGGGPVMAYVSEDGGTSFKPPVRVGGALAGEAQASARCPAPRHSGRRARNASRSCTAASTSRSSHPAPRPRAWCACSPSCRRPPTAPSSRSRRHRAAGSSPPRPARPSARSRCDLEPHGDPSDPAQWKRTTTSGAFPQLAGGPAGTALIAIDKGIEARTIGADGTAGPAVNLIADAKRQHGDPSQPVMDAAGTLHVAWTEPLPGSTASTRLVERTFSGGAAGARDTILKVPARSTLLFPAIGSLTDGGFAVVRAAPAVAGGTYDMLGVGYGSSAPTGTPGLGGVLGSEAPLDPGVTETCSESSFGAVDIVATGGCLLGAVGKPATKVSPARSSSTGSRSSRTTRSRS